MSRSWSMLVLAVLLAGPQAPASAQKLQVKEKSSAKTDFFGTPDNPQTRVFSPDGKLLCEARGFWLFDTETGKLIHDGRTSQLGTGETLAFSADGSLLAVGIGLGTGKKIVILWDVKSRKQTAVLRLPDSTANPDRVSLAFHPDGKTLAIFRDRVSLWEVTTGKERALLAFPDRYVPPDLSVRYTADGKLLYTPGLHSLRPEMAWETETDKLFEPPENRMIEKIQGRDKTSNLVLHPDLTVLAAVRVKNPDKVEVTFWDTKTGEERGTAEFAGGLTGGTFSPDGKLVAFQSKQGIELIAVGTGKHLATIEGGSGRLHFSKDGKTLSALTLASKTGEGAAIKVWELIWEKEPGK